MKTNYKLDLISIENYKDFDKIIVLTVRKVPCPSRSCRLCGGKGILLGKLKLFFLSFVKMMKRTFKQIATFFSRKKESRRPHLPEFPHLMVGQLEKY